MKRLSVLLITAVCCLTSCLYQSETDCIYRIGFTYTGSSSEAGLTPSEGADLVKEYKAAFSTLTENLRNEWTVTVRNDNYSSSDSKAKAEYESKLKDVKTFHETWQKKFDACSDEVYSYNTSYKFFLYRISAEGSVDLAEQTFEVSFN